MHHARHGHASRAWLFQTRLTARGLVTNGVPSVLHQTNHEDEVSQDNDYELHHLRVAFDLHI